MAGLWRAQTTTGGVAVPPLGLRLDSTPLLKQDLEWSDERRRRRARRGEPDPPRPTAVRRGGRYQTNARGLPRRGPRADAAGPARPAAVRDPGPARPGPLHAEERPQVHPGV